MREGEEGGGHQASVRQPFVTSERADYYFFCRNGVIYDTLCETKCPKM